MRTSTVSFRQSLGTVPFLHNFIRSLRSDNDFLENYKQGDPDRIGFNRAAVGHISADDHLRATCSYG